MLEHCKSKQHNCDIRSIITYRYLSYIVTLRNWCSKWLFVCQSTKGTGFNPWACGTCVFQCEVVSRPVDPQYQRLTEHAHATVDPVLTTNALLEELIPGPVPGSNKPGVLKPCGGLVWLPCGVRAGGPSGLPNQANTGRFWKKKIQNKTVASFKYSFNSSFIA